MNKSFQYPNGRLLIFTKAPIAGEVKTRLQPTLTPEQCTQLQEHLIEQTLLTATQHTLCPTALWCAGEFDHPFFHHCQKHFAISLKKQSGNNLGQRMSNALSHSLKDSHFTIIIGCDCPVLNSEHLAKACQSLQKHDIVIMPAEDGGYVLIGSRIDIPQIFDFIDWGSERVMQQTRQNLQQSNLNWLELETLWDIDRPNDLERLATIPAYAHWLEKTNI